MRRKNVVNLYNIKLEMLKDFGFLGVLIRFENRETVDIVGFKPKSANLVGLTLMFFYLVAKLSA